MIETGDRFTRDGTVYEVKDVDPIVATLKVVEVEAAVPKLMPWHVLGYEFTTPLRALGPGKTYFPAQ